MAGLVPAIHVLVTKRASKNVDARDKPGHDDVEAFAPGNGAYVAFLANVALRLSNSSTFTPLRRMMKLCWTTESRLFQAQ